MRASGISPSFLGLSRSSGQVAHVLRTRSPLPPGPKPRFSLDLHVLGAPPAFVLSQDQTLRRDLGRTHPRGAAPARDRRVARRPTLRSRGNIVPPGPGGPLRHGIDMSLRTTDRDRPNGGFTGFWRSLLCFQEAVPRRARTTAGAGERADVEATRTRAEAANDLPDRALVSSGSAVPGHVGAWTTGVRSD